MKKQNNNFKCPICGKDLVIASKSDLVIEHVCVNKDCPKYTSPKEIARKRWTNRKSKFYGTWIYRKIISRIAKMLNWKTYKRKLYCIKMRLKHGVWPYETYNVDVSICNYAYKIMSIVKDSDQYSWPEEYKNRRAWMKDLNKCYEVLKDASLFYNDYTGWRKLHGIKSVQSPMHIFPAADNSRNYEVKFFATKAENKQFSKDMAVEDKLAKDYKYWINWFVKYSADM